MISGPGLSADHGSWHSRGSGTPSRIAGHPLVLQLRLAACSDSLGYRIEGGSSHDGSRVDGDPDRLEGLPQGVAGETGASLRAGRDALVSLSVHRGAALAGGTQDRVDAG